MTETLDSVLRGAVRLYQHEGGYRVNVDSLLLVDFVGAPPFGRVLDLGTGSGVIALALAQRDPGATVDAVELQPGLAALATRNVELNQLGARVRVVEADLARARDAGLAGDAYDLVVSNPPYLRAEDGFASPSEEKAIARTELKITLAEVVRAARLHARTRGRVAVVYPAERAGELVATLEGERLRVARLRPVHARAGEPARRVLVEAVRDGRGPLSLLPPLVLYDAGGAPSAEHRAIAGDPAG
jgi:tRNA1(Val) A37 N6-methylase TrmN6